ncbi:MAG: efflux transporter outer membrane subunit [Pseudomonadota bacterium]
MNPLRTLLTLLAAGLCACAVGPDYEPVDFPVGDEWATIGAPTGTPPARWWEQFEDPLLDELIATALGENLDLRIAAERIAEARAAQRLVESQRRPAVEAAGSVARQRQSERGPLPAGRVPGIETYQTVYDVGLDARWELDVFGRIQRSVEAADARFEAAVEQLRDAQVTVSAEVARVYFELRGAQRELVAIEAAVQAGDDTLALVRRRYDAGSGSLVEVRQAEAEVATTRTRLAPVRARRDSAALALGALLGELPEAGLAMVATATTHADLQTVPVGTRADLLRRRPDVRRAERQLAAATADIGVAEGELYPKLVLGANGGFTSLASGDLFDADARRWTLAPFLSWRVLDGGRVQAEIAAADSRQQQAALAYERAILQAVTEAEQALSAYQRAVEGIASQQAALAAAAAAETLTRRRYEAGLVSLLVLLDAQRRVDDVEAQLARAQADAAVRIALLYKALGGGWEALDPDALASGR